MLKNYYLKEEGYDLLMDDSGFAAYKYDSENKNMYVGHFYVNPENRVKEGGAYKFFRKLKFRAKALGAERLVGDLFRNNANSEMYEKKLMIHIRHGYKIIDINKNCITVMKEL